jgi:hypothetical protein
MQDQQEGPIQRAQKDYPENTFQTVPSAILNDVRRGVLKRGDVCVYSVLKAHARNKTNVGYEFLAVKAACDISTIRLALVRLENAKHIRRKQNHDGGTMLLLTDVKPKGAVFVRGSVAVASPPSLDEAASPPSVTSVEVAAPPLLDTDESQSEQPTNPDIDFDFADQAADSKHDIEETQNVENDVPF